MRHTYDLTEVRKPGRWDHSPPQMRKLRPDRWRLLKVGGREVRPEATSTSSLLLGAAVSAASPTGSVFDTRQDLASAHLGMWWALVSSLRGPDSGDTTVFPAHGKLLA